MERATRTSLPRKHDKLVICCWRQPKDPNSSHFIGSADWEYLKGRQK